MRVAIVADSNSGITQAQGKELGIHVLPMPFIIDGDVFEEDINLTQEEFYRKLEADADVSTSQPTPETVMNLWDELLKEYDEIVHIPMSSALSGSCQTAMMLAEDYDGKVQVVNNQRISVTQRQSAMDAKELADAGMDAAGIKAVLEREKMESSIYVTIDTLKYLKKGGRLTPAAAALGTLLRIKPVLQIQGGKLDTFSKARTIKQAKATMISAITHDFESRFHSDRGENMQIWVAHTQNWDAAEELRAELEELFPKAGKIQINPLSLSVSCHIGPGALAIACSRKIDVEAEMKNYAERA